MDTKLGTGYSNSTGGLTGVDFYHIEWLASTRIPDGKVFTEKIDMSVTVRY
jgi:hypothetical protein